MPVMRRDTGKVRLRHAINPVGSGTAGGVLRGSLIGSISLTDLVIGAASGTRTGSLADTGVDDNS